MKKFLTILPLLGILLSGLNAFGCKLPNSEEAILKRSIIHILWESPDGTLKPDFTKEEYESFLENNEVRFQTVGTYVNSEGKICSKGVIESTNSEGKTCRKWGKQFFTRKVVGVTYSRVLKYLHLPRENKCFKVTHIQDGEKSYIEHSQIRIEQDPMYLETTPEGNLTFYGIRLHNNDIIKRRVYMNGIGDSHNSWFCEKDPNDGWFHYKSGDCAMQLTKGEYQKHLSSQSQEKTNN